MSETDIQRAMLQAREHIILQDDLIASLKLRLTDLQAQVELRRKTEANLLAENARLRAALNEWEKQA